MLTLQRLHHIKQLLESRAFYQIFYQIKKQLESREFCQLGPISSYFKVFKERFDQIIKKIYTKVVITSLVGISITDRSVTHRELAVLGQVPVSEEQTYIS